MYEGELIDGFLIPVYEGNINGRACIHKDVLTMIYGISLVNLL